jgi:hypothetical protein
MKEKAVAKFKTVQTVAQENDCDDRTVQKWCAANGVPYIGTGQRKQYMLYPDHEEEFKNRDKPGRRWPEKKKK